MTTPLKPDHEKRPFRFKLEGPFLRVSTMLLITPISPNFKGLKCSVFGCFRALQSRNIYGKTIAETFKKFYEVYSDRMITVADDSSYLMIDTNPYNYKGGDSSLIEAGLDHIETLNKALGLPDWLYEEMLNTRALDGRQKESFDNVTVTWSYHPDQGMEVIYRSNH